VYVNDVHVNQWLFFQFLEGVKVVNILSQIST